MRWHHGIPAMELVNALTMVPGVIVAIRRFNAFKRGICGQCKGSKDLARLTAVAVFVPVCAVSIAYHLADGKRPRSKRALLRADYTTQQLAAVATCIATYVGGGKAAATAVSGIFAISAVSASCLDARTRSGEAGLVFAQAAIVAIALRFRVDAVWLSALAARCASLTWPRSPWLHGAFHLIVIASFDRLWAGWLAERVTAAR
jgi:predicted membrane channel-forming protein YqfA (hemolysin III family)